MTGPIFLGLNRPQYVAVPETLISALAWRAYPANLQEDNGRAIGLRYRTSETGSSTLKLVATAPAHDQLATYGGSLASAGIAGEASATQLARAVEMSVRGVAASGGKSQAVSPLTPALALLQSPRGMMGSRNPPDIAEILEQMYVLGRSAPEIVSQHAVTERWLSASEHRLSRDHLLRAVDIATKSVLHPPAGVDMEATERRLDLGASKPLPFLGANTPFSWFRKSWDRITSSEWVEALPPRVWVDWATTILRLAYGLGFVWESLRFETAARAIVATKADADVSNTRQILIPWRSSRLSVGDRDVTPLLIGRAHRADRIRHFLDALTSEGELTVAELRTSAVARNGLQSILTSNERTRSGKNLWEASRYALMTRAVGGESADYYGFLRAHGQRYLTPGPGTEWIAVIASLACGRPNTSTTVHRVLADLGALGIRPELGDLIDLLERSGLARGSADADQALIVQSAY